MNVETKRSPEYHWGGKEAYMAGPRLGIRAITDPHTIGPQDAAEALAEIQRLLYFERDGDGGFIWNPSKDLFCPDAITEIDDIMGRYGLHPASGPGPRPFVHRPEEPR